MFVTVYLSRIDNCNNKENMLNSFYIHERWSTYFPAKNAHGQTLTKRDLLNDAIVIETLKALDITITKRLL